MLVILYLCWKFRSRCEKLCMRIQPACHALCKKTRNSNPGQVTQAQMGRECVTCSIIMYKPITILKIDSGGKHLWKRTGLWMGRAHLDNEQLKMLQTGLLTPLLKQTTHIVNVQHLKCITIVQSVRGRGKYFFKRQRAGNHIWQVRLSQFCHPGTHRLKKKLRKKAFTAKLIAEREQPE